MCAMNDGGNLTPILPFPLSLLAPSLHSFGEWVVGLRVLSPPWQPKNDFQVGPLIMKSKSKPKIRPGEFTPKNVKRAN